MTPKQERFVQEYLIDLNATQAAIRAGYSKKTAEQGAAQLLRNIKVARAIAEAQAIRAQKAGMNEQWVLDGLKEIAEDKSASVAARVTAYTNIGKHFGMFVERTVNENHNINADVTDEVMTPEQWTDQHKPH